MNLKKTGLAVMSGISNVRYRHILDRKQLERNITTIVPVCIMDNQNERDNVESFFEVN